jgi:hypothetical protein
MPRLKYSLRWLLLFVSMVAVVCWYFRRYDWRAELAMAVSTADRLVIDPVKYQENQTPIKVYGRASVEEFLSNLDFAHDRNSMPAIGLPLNGPYIHFYSADQLVATLECEFYNHGATVIWVAGRWPRPGLLPEK